MKTIKTLLLTSLVTSSLIARQTSKQEYIERFQQTAIEQMNRYKIPASITLAQGIIESGCGNSKLALEGNNHFGIKCHGTWTGKTMILSDDKPDDCFRVYETANASYIDHSVFLTSNKRYSELFGLELTDYKSWAKGLKASGYATSPTYADLLIKTIEDNKLYAFDELSSTNVITKTSEEIQQETRTTFVSLTKSNYIKAKKGDTYYRIAREYNLTVRQLERFNDNSPKKDFLLEGDIVFIENKGIQSKEKKYILENKMNWYEISQITGVRISKLIRKNKVIDLEKNVAKGTIINLR